MRGQQEVEAGGGASGARASTRLCLLAEVEDGGEAWWAGPAQELGRAATGEG